MCLKAEKKFPKTVLFLSVFRSLFRSSEEAAGQLML